MKPVKIIGRGVGVGKFKLPTNHKPFVKVSEGGSSCGTCKYLTEDNNCGNKYFIEFMGSGKLPKDVFNYCSDWWEPQK